MVEINTDFFQAITAISAIFIATVALWQTHRQGKAQRRHEELSVRPYLTVFVSTRAEGPRIFFEASLDNVGLGPAILTEFKVTNKGKPVTLVEIGDNVTEGFSAVHVQGYMTKCKNEAISANRKRILAQYSGEPTRPMMPDELEERFADLQINIAYTSMYSTETYYLSYTGEDLKDLRQP